MRMERGCNMSVSRWRYEQYKAWIPLDMRLLEIINSLQYEGLFYHNIRYKWDGVKHEN